MERSTAAARDLYTINPTDGTATDDGTLVKTGPLALFTDLDYAPNGVLYGVNSSLSGNNTDSLYSINPATATATLIGKTGGDLESIASIPEPKPRLWLWLAFGGLAVWGYARRRDEA